MSNAEMLRTTQYNILSLINILGVSTHAQIISQEFVHAKRLTLHIDKLLSASRIEELSARHYYAGSKGRPSPVYQLTQAGADWLTANRHSRARASGLKADRAVNHALAMLDCRLALLRSIPKGNVVTDRQITYGASVIRPDNLLTFKDGRASILFESEGLGHSRNSGNRIHDKVANLTAFFLCHAPASPWHRHPVGSETGYDPDVRIVYLWRPTDHSKALSLWIEACHEERVERGLEELPFRLLFIPHAKFREYAPLEEGSYEALTPHLVAPETAPVPPGRRRVVEAARSLPAPQRETRGLAPVRPVVETPLLDEATITFLLAFREAYAQSFGTAAQMAALVSLVHDYLASRPGMAEALQGHSVLRAGSHTSQALAMEAFALTFFRILNIPASIVEEERCETPILLEGMTDGRSHARLLVRIEPSLSGGFRDLWRDGVDDLARTFQLLFRMLLRTSHGEAMIPEPPKKEGKRRDYFD